MAEPRWRFVLDEVDWKPHAEVRYRTVDPVLDPDDEFSIHVELSVALLSETAASELLRWYARPGMLRFPEGRSYREIPDGSRDITEFPDLGEESFARFWKPTIENRMEGRVRVWFRRGGVVALVKVVGPFMQEPDLEMVVRLSCDLDRRLVVTR